MLRHENSVPSIYNTFCSVLEDSNLNCEHNPRARLVEMFHGRTPETVKKHIVMQFASIKSCLRVLICTVTFGMGVHCRNVNESIHFGSPKNTECYVQESGRIGRDGTIGISRILYSWFAINLSGCGGQCQPPTPA